MTALSCSHGWGLYGQSQVIVRNGKGGKRGEIIIGKELKRHLKAFLSAKRAWGEDVSGEAHLLLSKQQEPFTTRGLQMKFKAIARKAGLPGYYSIHCLRHYAEFRIMPSRLPVAA